MNFPCVVTTHVSSTQIESSGRKKKIQFSIDSERIYKIRYRCTTIAIENVRFHHESAPIMFPQVGKIMCFIDCTVVVCFRLKSKIRCSIMVAMAAILTPHYKHQYPPWLRWSRPSLNKLISD